MILNGYSTFVGKKFAVNDGVISTLKMLVTTKRLEEFNSKKVTGVFAVTHQNGDGINPFIFPITFKDNLGRWVTVYDKRHYTNSKGSVSNTTELEVIEIASVLQQKAANNDYYTLQAARPYTIKAFARSVGFLLSKEGKLDLQKTIKLEIILAYFQTCLLVNSNDDYKFVATNVIKNALGYEAQTTLEVINDLGFFNTVEELLKVLKNDPELMGLHRLDMGGLISVINKTWFVLSGFKILIGASIEMPHLYTAICFASATNRIYQNTGIGKVLDIRQNPKVSDFIALINGNV